MSSATMPCQHYMSDVEKINMPNSINYETAEYSAGSSLYEDCLWVNLSFTEQLSVSIFGICEFF